jgi:hypothetical protein
MVILKGWEIDLMNNVHCGILVKIVVSRERDLRLTSLGYLSSILNLCSLTSTENG